MSSRRPYVIRPGSRIEILLQAMAAENALSEWNTTNISAVPGTPVTGVCVMLKAPVAAGLLAVRPDGHRVLYAITAAGRAAAAGLPAPDGACEAGPAPAAARKAAAPAATPAPAPAPAASAAPQPAGEFTVALYNDGEMYLHGVRIDEHNGVLLSAAQAAELREYLLHTGSFIEFHQGRSA